MRKKHFMLIAIPIISLVIFCIIIYTNTNRMTADFRGIISGQTTEQIEYYNNDLGKAAYDGENVYYIEDEKVYISQNDQVSALPLEGVYCIQYTNDTVYAISYENKVNTVYNISKDLNKEFAFETEEIPKKAMIGLYGYFYLENGVLNFISNNDDRSKMEIEKRVLDYTVTNDGIYYTVFAGDLGDQTQLFSDLSEISLSSELWYQAFEGEKILIDKWDESNTTLLTNMNNGVLYRDYEGIYYAEGSEKKQIIENDFVSSIIADSENIYYFDDVKKECVCFDVPDENYRYISERALQGITGTSAYTIDDEWIKLSDEN